MQLKLILATALAAGALVSACATKPTVTKQVTTMTPKQIEEAGLECKRVVPIDSNIPQTICATPTAWAAYDKDTRAATEGFFDERRELPTAGRFSRN